MRITPVAAAALLLAACSSGTAPTTTFGLPTAPLDDETTTATSPPGEAASVVHVFDGDSLLVSVDGAELEVRLLGINAPEGSECHGDEARDTLEQLLDSGDLVLVADNEESDQYGRSLRYLYVDGLNVNLAMIANGDAIALQGDHGLDAEFTAIADAAAQDQLGLWAPDACGSDGAPSAVQIVDYVYNPSGRDAENMNGEWIAIANEGDDVVDLSGWVLRDESTQHRYLFPAGYALGPNDEVLVHTGCDRDSQTDLYWCAEDPVWSNGGDTVILQLPDGTVVDRDRFDGDF